MKWIQLTFNESDYKQDEEYPIDVIERTLNRIKAINFVIVDKRNLVASEKDNFYCEILALVEDKKEDK